MLRVILLRSESVMLVLPPGRLLRALDRPSTLLVRRGLEPGALRALEILGAFPELPDPSSRVVMNEPSPRLEKLDDLPAGADVPVFATDSVLPNHLRLRCFSESLLSL